MKGRCVSYDSKERVDRQAVAAGWLRGMIVETNGYNVMYHTPEALH